MTKVDYFVKRKTKLSMNPTVKQLITGHDMSNTMHF